MMTLLATVLARVVEAKLKRPIQSARALSSTFIRTHYAGSGASLGSTV